MPDITRGQGPARSSTSTRWSIYSDKGYILDTKDNERSAMDSARHYRERMCSRVYVVKSVWKIDTETVADLD